MGEPLSLPLSWERLFKLASHHRVLPAVWSALGGRSGVPASIHSALYARFRAHAQRVLRFSVLLQEILQKFADCGIEALPHKGLALSQQLYGDPTMREFGDLDFLIRPEDVGRAREALRALGYQPNVQLSPRQEREYLRSGYEYVFGAGREPYLLELQWQVLPRFYTVGFAMPALFERSVELTVDGCGTRALCNEDLLLVLCVHAAKHQWVHLGMLRDIATLASRRIDWPSVYAQAERLGILRILWVSLLLARDLLDYELPEIPIRSAEVAVAEEFASAVELQLDRGDSPEVESIRYFSFMMKLRERRPDRARFLWRLASTPSVGEWKAVRFPDVLFPLYRGVRAMRLAARAISGLV